MTYAMTYVYLGCVVLQAVLATALWVAMPRQPARRCVVSIMVAGFFWSLADLLSNLAQTSEQMRLLLWIFVFAWVVVPYLLLRAAAAYAGHSGVFASAWLNGLLLLPAIGICWLTWTDRLFVDFIPAGTKAPYFHSVSSPWQLSVTVYFLLYLIGSAAILMRAARRSGRREFSRLARLLVWAVLPAVVLGLLTNGGLSLAGAFTPYVGSMIMTAACLVVAVGILRREFLNPLVEIQGDYQALLDTSPDGIVILDLEGRFVTVNNMAAEIMGCESADEFLAHYGNGADVIVPGDVEAATRSIGELLETGKVIRREYRVCRLDKVALPVEASIGLLRGNDGQPRGLIAITRDLTQRKRAESERHRLEAQLQHAQKLESMGILAGGIAHDFNNLLVGMLGNASLLKEEVPRDSSSWDRVCQIEMAAQRAAGLTGEMLAYSGRGKFIIEPLDLSRLVGDISRLLEVSISKKIEITYHYAAGIPVVCGDASQLQQVIMNLITNASEAIGDNAGQIELESRRREVSAGELVDSSSNAAVKPGSYVCLSVRDSGSGMEAETLSCMFDPFFTTKFTGRGLGLAAVQGIVHGHDGAVIVESELGVGSTVCVLFPCSPGLPTRASSRLTPLPLSSDGWQGSGLVLIVDDEDLVREVAALTLQRAGFSILTAVDGEDGVRVFEDSAGDVTAVVLDLTMPRMDGREALLRMRRIRPNVPVIITSGYAEQEVSARIDDEAIIFVQKPFSPMDLVGALRSHLAPRV